MDDLTELVLGIIAKYRPPRRILHSLVYLGVDGDGGLEWRLGLMGPYSPFIDRIIEELLGRGIVRICVNDRLTLDECPLEDWDASMIVSKAVSKYLIEYTLGYNGHDEKKLPG